jgi:NAD(P)-dependent dehydrogenase (short-subunit alcohol dehydrogenase family)
MSEVQQSGEGHFAGKVAILTGAASLIGVETIRQLLEEGACVVACDTEANAHHLAEVGTSGRLLVLPGDVADDGYLMQVVNSAVQHFGGVDMLVTAAAIFADPGVQATQEDWRRIFDVNVISVARLVNLCAPHMKARGGGAIVIVSSISGHRSQPGRVLYPTTKAALLGVSRNSAQALASDRIRVNALLPGWTWSRNIERRYGSRERADAFAAEFQYWGRMADPKEIADGIIFLLSDKASFITGAELNVDGGYLGAGPEATGQAMEKVPVIWSP